MSKHTPSLLRDIPVRAIDLEAHGVSIIYVTTDDERVRHESIANARLIAAAPDLLAMLKDCRDYLSCIPESAAGGDDMAVTLTRACDAAIKQAIGVDE